MYSPREMCFVNPFDARPKPVASVGARISKWNGHDLQFSVRGLVCDGGYPCLDNFAAIEADPDAGAYAVIHIVSVLALVDSDPERSPLHLTSD